MEKIEIKTNSELFLLVREVVRDFTKSNNFNRQCGSYRLKHLVEDYLKLKTDCQFNHVPNGYLIKAMELEDFEWKPQGPNWPNAFFKVDQKSIERKLKDIKLENIINSNL